MLELTPNAELNRAHLTLNPVPQIAYRISPLLYGKFCEHLGRNIYQGMDAQILVNPTLAKWVFSAGDDGVDGGLKPEYSLEKIGRHAAAFAAHEGFPATHTLLEDYKTGGAFGWFRLGTSEAVRLSPDVGPHGGRAQRIEILSAEGGLAQWVYLPLHRIRRFEFRLVGRAAHPVEVSVSLDSVDADGQPAVSLGSVSLILGSDWTTQVGTLEVSAEAAVNTEGLFRVALQATGPANIVLSRLLLYPADHIDSADPEIVAHLRESRLPLLRWPGGNFVSGYCWRDGIGPVDARPTRPNPAWGGLEYNLFGTLEFARFCRACGCEPMICINAGDGAPEEAAEWVEYCNGSADTPLGRLRAEHGHPEPLGIRYWEIGNEIFGSWQVSHTTPGGNVDRYQQFRAAMLVTDPDLLLLGCGFPWWPENDWDMRLIAEAGPDLRCLTDHILTGGSVNAHTDPAELYHAFLGQAVDVGRRYRAVAEQMRAAGNSDPRLAITELQLFAHFHAEPLAEQGSETKGALSAETMPTPGTISEALYFTTMAHEAIRMEGLVEMITHSATVNHGGGLRKARERVWANPVHYAHLLGAALFDGAPLNGHLSCGVFSTHAAFQGMPALTDVPVLDVIAARSADGRSLVVMLAHRSAASGPIVLTLETGQETSTTTEVMTLAGETMWAENTREVPTRIAPRASTLDLPGGRGEITLPPYSLTRLIIPLDNQRFD
jgi:alpha-N-arabinofuranosidase